MSINYYKCINQANRLQRLANEYQGMYNYISSLANNSSGYWQGKANDAFRSKVAQWRREAQSIRYEMEELSILIKQTAREVEEEEM